MFKDTTPESPISEYLFRSLTTYNFPRHLRSRLATSLLVFGDECAFNTDFSADSCDTLLGMYNSCCDIHALRGSSPRMSEKGVKFHHRMSIFRLCIALV